MINGPELTKLTDGTVALVPGSIDSAEIGRTISRPAYAGLRDVCAKLRAAAKKAPGGKLDGIFDTHFSIAAPNEKALYTAAIYLYNTLSECCSDIGKYIVFGNDALRDLPSGSINAAGSGSSQNTSESVDGSDYTEEDYDDEYYDDEYYEDEYCDDEPDLSCLQLPPTEINYTADIEDLIRMRSEKPEPLFYTELLNSSNPVVISANSISHLGDSVASHPVIIAGKIMFPGSFEDINYNAGQAEALACAENFIFIDVRAFSEKDVIMIFEEEFAKRGCVLASPASAAKHVNLNVTDREETAVKTAHAILNRHLLSSPGSGKITAGEIGNVLKSLDPANYIGLINPFAGMPNGLPGMVPLPDTVTAPAAAPAEKDCDPLGELDRLVGLHNVKTDITDTVNVIAIQKKITESARAQNRKVEHCSSHMLFEGSPGTCKTTVGRIFAQLLYKKGLIPSPANFTECTKSDIVGQFVGQTCAKIDAMFRSMHERGGGVLFFDEIYSISEANSTCYDVEAVNSLNQNMENYRGTVYCIFAGYTDKMAAFLNANRGLRSRIPFTITFDDYTNDDLYDIFISIAESSGFEVSGDCRAETDSFFGEIRKLEGQSFGNGREARNLFTNAMTFAARRYTGGKLPESFTLLPEDIREAADSIIKKYRRLSSAGKDNGLRKVIGF